MNINTPLKLSGEIVWRTYTGGREIQKMHGEEHPVDSHFPEEWMYSVTRAMNAGREDVVEGLCRVAEEADMTLKELLETYPEEMLGKKHVKTWGNTLGVLIKIIDSQERLTIQVHPDKVMAKELFGSRFGKTECWHILDIRKDSMEVPCIYLGFREGITRESWEECFREQDYERMLGMLNKIEVSPGETYLVKGGIPHAIGSGCLIMEIQEPTDYTVRVEKVTPSGYRIADSMCHQGLGFEKMFDCFYYKGYTADEIMKRFRIKKKVVNDAAAPCEELVGYEDTPCFRIRLYVIEGFLGMEGGGTEGAENTFSCLYVLDGHGELKTSDQCHTLKKNSQFFIPANCEKFNIYNQESTCMKILIMNGPI